MGACGEISNMSQSSNMPCNSVICKDDEKKSIHVKSTRVSYRSYDYKQFIHMCDNNEVLDEYRPILWYKLLEDCVDEGDGLYSLDEDSDDVPDDDATNFFEEMFNDHLGDIVQDYEIKKAEEEESVEGCEEPYPETKDHRPAVKIDLDKFLDEGVEVPEVKAPKAKAHFTPEQHKMIEKVVGESLAEDFDVTKDNLLQKVKAHADKAYYKMRRAEIHRDVIIAAAKAFDDVMTITEGSNIFVRQSIMYRMEELNSKLVNICKMDD